MEEKAKTVKCIKCQKDIPAEQGIETTKGLMCQECAKKAKTKRYTIVGVVAGLAIAAAIGGYTYTAQQKYNGFDGVGNINDSTNVSVSDVDSLKYIEGIIAARDTVSGSQTIDNIEAFNTQFAKNMAKSIGNKAGSVIIPSISALFEINTNYFVKNGDELVREFAKTYLRTNKEAEILIEGYTCDLGDAYLNNKLSELRCKAVKDVLISAGVPADKIEAKWYGKSRFNEFTYPEKGDYRRVMVSVK